LKVPVLTPSTVGASLTVSCRVVPEETVKYVNGDVSTVPVAAGLFAVLSATVIKAVTVKVYLPLGNSTL